MKRWWTLRWKTIVIVVVAVIAIVVGSMLLKVLGLDPNAFAAVASAAAAIAAFASARESSSTARNAIRALSLTSKPSLYLECWDQNNQLALYIRNQSVHPVARAEVRWKLRNGQRGSQTLDRLDGIRIASDGLTIGNKGPTYPTVYLIPYPGRTDGIDEVTIDYWGDNGPIGWRLTQTFNHLYGTSTLPDGSQAQGWSVGSPTRSETELA